MATTGDPQCPECGSWFCSGSLDMFARARCRLLRSNYCDCRSPERGILGRCTKCRKTIDPIRAQFERIPDAFELPDDELDEMTKVEEPMAGMGVKKAADATKDDLVAFLTAYLRDPVFAQRFADCVDLIRAKNADYSQGEDKKDRIAAFRRISRDIDVSMPKVWAIFAQKHWGAVMKYVKDGTVESEPIDGRINDLINYFVLLGAIVGDGK